MNKKILIGNTRQTITLNDKMYLAAGGEGSVYANTNAGKAYKLYHDPDTKMLPLQKMKELSLITNSKVIIPKEVIYDATSNKPLGYTTDFIDHAEPLLKLFTKTFKDDNNVNYQMINELVKRIQMVVTDVHKARCLIVDLNELNILFKLSSNDIDPWFIDTDSYATPSYKASAVMESIMDRKCAKTINGHLNYNPNEMSDWFSWAVITFNLYTNIHPFRGRHKSYKPNEKKKQMDDGISVFHKDVNVPPCVNNFNIIPKRHLEWYKDVFLNNNRSVPPLPDSIAPIVVPNQIVMIKGTDKLSIIDISTYGSDITSIHYYMGIYYIVSKTHVYAGNKEIGNVSSKKTLLCNSNDGTLIESTINGFTVTFSNFSNKNIIGTIDSSNMFQRNGVIYTITNDKLAENTFISVGTKLVHRITEVENVSGQTAKMYDGCVIQDLLGKKYLTLPYKVGSCFSKYIKELDGYRIVDAKSDKTVTVIIAEKKNVFYRFIIVFDKKYENFEIRVTPDISYDTINFAVLDNGLCVLLSSDDEIEIFSKANQYETLNNPPFDSTMKLFSFDNQVFVINKNSYFQIKKK